MRLFPQDAVVHHHKEPHSPVLSFTVCACVCTTGPHILPLLFRVSLSLASQACPHFPGGMVVGGGGAAAQSTPASSELSNLLEVQTCAQNFPQSGQVVSHVYIT